MKKVFVSGDFNILHPGHLRLLKFAKESGDYLIVGVNSDLINRKGIPQSIRLESIRATSFVDEAFILETTALEYIKNNKPDIVVKGKEYEYKENLEIDFMKSYGGKVLFTSGTIGFSSIDFLKQEFLRMNNTIEHCDVYLKRHNITISDLNEIIKKFSTLKVLVIGDTIVDEYITCEPLGMSQEDPTIVVSPILTNKFIGGAAIVASHAKTLGAEVKFISVVGDDENYQFVQNELNNLSVNTLLLKDNTRQTTLKQRYRANGKTLLRVNHLKQHHISQDIEDEILKNIIEDIQSYDLIVFSDFSYGVITKKIIDEISNEALKNSIKLVADSQSSSQIGDISKFKNMTLVTPTEREIRLALNDFESGLVVLSEKLVEYTSNKYIFTTLGSEGIVIYNSNSGELLTDNIPALGLNVKDVSGAGDSLLICSSLAIAVGATVWESAYLGSLSAAIQVGRIGNIPIQKHELIDIL